MFVKYMKTASRKSTQECDSVFGIQNSRGKTFCVLFILIILSIQLPPIILVQSLKFFQFIVLLSYLYCNPFVSLIMFYIYKHEYS